MSAPSQYITSVLFAFQAFLHQQETGDNTRAQENATLLLLSYLEYKTDLNSWSIDEFEHFLESSPEAQNFSSYPKQLVSQFVRKYPPYQTSVLLHHFTLALKADQCSYSTLKNYRSDINQFLHFARETEVLRALSKPKIVAFLRSQRQKGLKRSTANRKLVSLTQFAIWLEKSGYLEGVSSWLNELGSRLAELSDQWDLPEGSTEASSTLDQADYQDERQWTLPLPTSPQLSTTDRSSITESVAGVAGLANAAIAEPAATQSTPVATAQHRQEFRSRLKQHLTALSRRVKNENGNKPFLPYLNLAVMVLFLLGVGVFGYQQFIRDTVSPFAYPSTLTRPNRTLSFQGRLTDTNRNPITGETDMRFKLYDSGPGIGSGNILWDSGTCTVDPDQDGIFSTGLGDECGDEITDDVFTENSNVWLQVEIDNGVTYEVLEPRQSIKTVPYALNSETLQGFPASMSATENTVVVMNADGDIELGSLNPDLRSTNGTFTIEAQSLVLQTVSGSNGDIVLAPDGTGQVGVLSNLFMSGYLSAPGATLSATYAGGIPLVVNGVSGQTANLTEWHDGDGNVTVVDEDGRIGIGTSNPSYGLDVNGDARISTLGGGATDTVVTHASGVLQSRSIDSRVWGTSLVDGSSLTANFLTKVSDANTIINSIVFDDGTNVGIGTTNPTVGLHVRKQDSTFGGDDFGASSAINIAVGAGLHEPILRFKTDSTSRWELFAYGTTSANAGKFGIADGGNHSSPALVIDTDKRVGIGTTSPETILDVGGHITSRGSSSGLSVYKPSDSSTRVSLDWAGDMATILLAPSGSGAISGLGVYDTFAGTNYLHVSGSGIIVGTPNPIADPFVANLPAASIALPENGLIQGGLTAANFSAFQTTAQAGSPAGYGAWMTHNAYFDGTNWRQPRGTGTASFLYTTNNHLGWSWRYAGSNGTDNAVITPGEVASLSSSGVLRLPLSGAVLHAGTASTTYQIPHGGGSNFLPQIQNNQSSGVAGISVGVSNSTNRRAGLFMDDTNTAWGLSFTFGSGGGVPFVINMAGNERMRVTYTGNVGIGTTNPGVPLHVAGNARVTFAAAAANTVCRDGNGTFSVCSSLSQYKDNQKNLSLGLDTIMQLRPVEFDWNINDKSHDLGLIAEEVAAVNPILAQYESDGTLSGVKYHHMTALLIKGIQQQQTQIATLSSQLATLNPNNFATLQLDSFFIDSTGNLAIEQTEQGEYQVRNTADNSLAAVMGRMAELVVGKIRAGSIAVRELSTDAITIAGLPLRDYIASTVMQMGGTQNETGSAELLSPVAKLDNLEVTGASLLAELLVTEDATFSGTLTAETTRLGELTANSATIEGTLIADNIATENIEADTIFAATISAYSSRLALLEARTAEFENMKAQTAELMEATVSGTLYANNIYNFDDKIASAFNEPTMTDILKNKVFDSINTTQNSLALVYDSVQLAGYEATSSAGLNLTLADIQTEGDDLNLGAATVFVDQYFKVNGIAYVADSLGVGNKLLIGQGMAIADGMINYTAPFGSEQLFQIQPSGRGTLSLMAGLMSLTENGNVIIDGNLAVTGNLAVQDTLLTNLMQPADFGNPFQVQVAGVSDDGTTVRDSRFEIVNEIGTPVATISAQGRAEFASGIGVGAENLGENENNEATAGKTSGKATILAGQSQLTIRSEKITANSLVYVTPVGSTQNQVLYVKSQTAENPDTSEKEGKFVVGFDSPVTEAVQFNWWIIN